MKNSNTARTRTAAVAVLTILTAMTGFTGCSKKKGVITASGAKIVLPVRATAVERGRIETWLAYSGSIAAKKRASIAPMVPGRIERILVEEGQKVGAGQLLVRMDDKQLLQIKSGYLTAKNMYERIKTLHERGSATPQQFEQASAGYETARAAYEQMQESVELHAPFSGVIVGKHYQDGELFSAMKPGPEGLPAIVSLARLDMMEISVNVPERDFVRIRQALPAYITLDALPGTVFTALVTRISPALDMMSRTATVTIEVPNPDRALKPGMFARVKIVTDLRDSVLIVPSVAVVRRGDSSFVFTVPAGSVPYETTPSQIAVSIGLSNDQAAECAGDGLSEGALVIHENNTSLKSGTLVEVVSVSGVTEKQQ